MSKTAAELLRELDATTAWPKYPYTGTLRAAAEADMVMKALPLLAAVLDAADYMKDRALEHDGDTDQHGPCAVCRGARYDYEQKRAALAEALEEGR